MQIDLSKKEFRRLLDMVYIGNWILNSTRGDDRFADYDDLESKLFALCRGNGMDALVERYEGTDVPSRAFSDGGIHEAIMDYEDTVFYEILAEEPFNRDAMTGKNLIARQKAVENRLEHLAERARPAIPEPRPDADPEEPGKAEESAPVREPRFKLLRSKKVRAVLIALFAVVFLVAIYCTCGYGYFR